MKKLFFIVFIALFFSFFSYALDTPLPKAKPESVGFSSERLNKIDTVFNKGIKENKIPGAVIAIARN